MVLSFEPRDLQGIFLQAEAELLRRRREDERDFNAEMVGIDNGKLARFLTGEERERRRDERRGEGSTRSERERLSRLQMLLASNPAYAKAYGQTMDSLRGAEEATDRALLKAQARLDEAKRKLQDTLDRAARLPDGTRVFRDKWGQVWTKYGERLSEADSAGIEWRSGHPGYEALTEDREAVQDSLTRLEALQGYRVDTLGRVRDRMTDQDNPPSVAEMEKYRQDIHDKMPVAAQAEMSHRAPIAPNAAAVSTLDVPTL